MPAQSLPTQVTPRFAELTSESTIAICIFYALRFRNYAANQRRQFVRAGNCFDDLVEICDLPYFSLPDEALDLIRQISPRFSALFYPRYSRLSGSQSASQVSLTHPGLLPGSLQPLAQVFIGAVACVHSERI